MKIKKVDDKPMVIHTKKKAKIHMHEPKKAKIKGSNIYTVQRGPKIASAIVGSGILSYAANLILLVALARVPASTQYPMVTGGVMAVSALLSCCTGERPTRRELGALALAIAGVCVTALR